MINVTGINKHEIPDIPITTVVAYTPRSNHGPCILIFNEAAFTRRHQTILSCLQLEDYGAVLDEKHPRMGGTCRITTENGFIFPLSYSNG